MTFLPNVPIPDPMRGLEPNTWANRTISTRFSDTVRRILAEEEFPQEIQFCLFELIADIPQAGIRFLTDAQAPDFESWNGYIAAHLEQDWFQPPWFFVEHYFYRRIIEASGYYQSGPGLGRDPFLVTKRTGLTQSLDAIANLAAQLSTWQQPELQTIEILQSMLYIDLWGNQADYSLWPADADDEFKPDHASLTQAAKFLLCDDSSKISEYILSLEKEATRIDFLIDNAGMELVVDLASADYLLTSGLADTVHFHLKVHPTFVSDALPKDVEETLTFLKGSADRFVQALGKRLQLHLNHQRIMLKPAFFWNSPQAGWQIPANLYQDLSKADLVISKGDANYRRLLDDRHWPYTTPFAEIVAYFPAPLVALRTLKSELVCGLQTGQAESVARSDPDWMINGRWGLVQFAKNEN